MSRVIEIRRANQRLGVLPEQGGALAYWDCLVDGQWQALLRPWQASPDIEAAVMACFPLLPWSNRIGGGGFTANDRFHALAPNRSGRPMPIHGNGWMQAWQIAAQTDHSLNLSLRSQHMHGYPFDYQAQEDFCLSEEGLTISLSLRHEGAERMPYGLGQHPYFKFPPGSRIGFQAKAYWLGDINSLSTELHHGLPANMNFSQARAPGEESIDAVLSGWDGQMQLQRPDLGLQIEMRCCDSGGHAILYAPQGQGWLCFEPVTHPNNAHNLPGMPGLRWLAPGEAMQLTMQLRLRPLA